MYRKHPACSPGSVAQVGYIGAAFHPIVVTLPGIPQPGGVVDGFCERDVRSGRVAARDRMVAAQGRSGAHPVGRRALASPIRRTRAYAARMLRATARGRRQSPLGARRWAAHTGEDRFVWYAGLGSTDVLAPMALGDPGPSVRFYSQI